MCRDPTGGDARRAVARILPPHGSAAAGASLFPSVFLLRIAELISHHVIRLICLNSVCFWSMKLSFKCKWFRQIWLGIRGENGVRLETGLFAAFPCRCASLPTSGHEFSRYAQPFLTKFVSNLGNKIIFRMKLVSFDLIQNRARNCRTSDGRSRRWFFCAAATTRRTGSLCRVPHQTVASVHTQKQTNQGS
jgi:hypothetical protein